jgi:hypothetical protein
MNARSIVEFTAGGINLARIVWTAKLDARSGLTLLGRRAVAKRAGADTLLAGAA